MNRYPRLLKAVLAVCCFCLSLDASNASPLIGAIRWDAQVGDMYDYATMENRFLSPKEYRNRIPFYGKLLPDGSVHLDATDPSVMEQEIAYASEAGLDYWAFLTYENNTPGHWGYGLGLQLENYLNSPSKSAINFAVILADKNNIGNDESEWPRWIARYVEYLQDPQYQIVLDGRPLVYTFRYANWERGPAFVKLFRKACREANLPEPYLVDLHWNNTLTEGVDAMSSYANGVYRPELEHGTILPYQEQITYDRQKWMARKNTGVKQIPIITTGWDARPRLEIKKDEETRRMYNPIVATAKPEEIAANLRNAIRFVRENPANCEADTVLIYGWNEFSEGGFICPVLEEFGGIERLEAISRVLSDEANPKADAVPGKPNILFILADDLGYEDLGCYGNSFHETPNIDRLASEGIKLTRHYSAGAVCSPTRASILTGNFPARLRVTEVYNLGFREDPNTPLVSDIDDYMDPAWAYLPASMQKLGYATGMFGKWHLDGVTPAETGFDTVRINYPNLPGEWFAENVFDKDEWKTDQITRDAVDFIRNSVSNKAPFFAYVSHNLPHVPWGTRSDLLEKYREKERRGKGYQGPTYAGMMEQLDESVESLVSTLEELGILDNTLVIFTSDNGPVGKAKTRLNRGKSFPFEGGIRVPFVAKWPRNIEEGIVRDDVVVSPDYFQTFYALAGGDPESLGCTVKDSENFLPVLLGGKMEPRNPIIFHFPRGRNYMGPWSAIIDGHWKYIHFWEGTLTPDKARPQERKNQLFNLEKDEQEKHNLIDTNPAKAASLRTQLMDWLKENDCQIPEVRNPQ